jgi:hypothetical protein
VSPLTPLPQPSRLQNDTKIEIFSKKYFLCISRPPETEKARRCYSTGSEKKNDLFQKVRKQKKTHYHLTVTTAFMKVGLLKNYEKICAITKNYCDSATNLETDWRLLVTFSVFCLFGEAQISTSSRLPECGHQASKGGAFLVQRFHCRDAG